MPDFTVHPELTEHLNHGNCVLFIGADLPHKITGLPSRADLAHGMARRYNLAESLSLAEVAQRVSQAGNRFEFTDFIRNALDISGKLPSVFHQGIVTLVKRHGIETVITTAYDNLLEVAFHQAGVGINRVVRGSDVSFIRPDRPTLIKLYGDAQQPDTLVVTDRDHSQLLRARDKEDLIDEVRRAFKRTTVLFYGYNLSDPDFKFLFDQIAESQFARLAYAVWPGLPEADVRMWRDRNIIILEEDPLNVLSRTPTLSSTTAAELQVNLPAGSVEVSTPANFGTVGASDLILPQIPNVVTLRTYHDYFVTLDPTQDGMLIGNTEADTAEPFTLLRLSNGKIALRASNGQYVTAVYRGRWPLLANAPELGEAQQFDMQRLDDGRVFFKTTYRRNVTAMDDQPGWHWEIRAETDQVQAWEKFTLVPAAIKPEPLHPPEIPHPSEKWLDCEVRLHDRSEAGYKVEMTLNGEQTIGGVMPADAASFIPTGDPRDDGQRLFNILFADKELREAWGEARGQSKQRRLRLRIDPPELRRLPWEVMRDDDDILAAQADTPFSRYLATDQPWGGTVAARPIRMLAVISNPIDLSSKYELPAADPVVEEKALREAVMGLGAQVQLDFLDTPITLERLEEQLRSSYHVLHFIGHGAFSAKKQQAALYLQNEDGTAQRITDDELAGMLKRLKLPPQLIVLAACQSAQQSMQDAFSGLGPKLVQIGIPAVVAMQDNVTMLTARRFGAKFYRRLLEHGTVDLAMNEARSTLITNGRFDAAAPVLFMRLRDGQLLSDLHEAMPRAEIDAPPSPVTGTQPTQAEAERSEWNFEVIRNLLTAAFNDSELTNFCFDHFPEVYETFGSGMSKSQKIQELLDHCRRHMEVERLLLLIKTQNPNQYARFAATLNK